ncbi:hypothetical protein BC832DRAFT_305019 [Gaertneriomyces semiglobifer]|nr:hypothetical protein BC832DRAFT_305019 [Gaertneriomyces semiglobifer]
MIRAASEPDLVSGEVTPRPSKVNVDVVHSIPQVEAMVEAAFAEEIDGAAVAAEYPDDDRRSHTTEEAGQNPSPVLHEAYNEGDAPSEEAHSNVEGIADTVDDGINSDDDEESAKTGNTADLELLMEQRNRRLEELNEARRSLNEMQRQRHQLESYRHLLTEAMESDQPEHVNMLLQQLSDINDLVGTPSAIREAWSQFPAEPQPLQRPAITEEDARAAPGNFGGPLNMKMEAELTAQHERAHHSFVPAEEAKGINSGSAVDHKPQSDLTGPPQTEQTQEPINRGNMPQQADATWINGRSNLAPYNQVSEDYESDERKPNSTAHFSSSTDEIVRLLAQLSEADIAANPKLAEVLALKQACDAKDEELRRLQDIRQRSMGYHFWPSSSSRPAYEERDEPRLVEVTDSHIMEGRIGSEKPYGPLSTEVDETEEISAEANQQLASFQHMKEKYEHNQRDAQEQMLIFQQRRKDLEELKAQFEEMKALMENVDGGDSASPSRPQTQQSRDTPKDPLLEMRVLQRELERLNHVKTDMEAKLRSHYNIIESTSSSDSRSETHSPLRGVEAVENSGIHTELEQLMRRLVQASVEESGLYGLNVPSKASVQGDQAQSPAQSARRTEPQQLQFAQQNTSTTHSKQTISPKKPLMRNLNMNIEDGTDSYMDSSRSRGREELTIGRIDEEMRKIFMEMQTINQLRSVASGAHREQFDRLYSHLQSQLDELTEVQNQAAYYQQISEKQSGGHIESQDQEQLNFEEEARRGFAALNNQPLPEDTLPTAADRAGMNTLQSAAQGSHLAVSSSDAYAPVNHEPTTNKLRSRFASTDQYGAHGYHPVPSHAHSEASRLEHEAWVEDGEYETYPVPQRPPDSHTENASKQLFNQYSDKIYRHAAYVISQFEAEPYFLLQIFRGLERCSSGYAKQRLLLALDDIVEELGTMQVQTDAPHDKT